MAPATKTKRIKKNLGKNWGKAIQDLTTKEAAKVARAVLKAGKYTGDGTVEVKNVVSLQLIFARKGSRIDGGGATVRAVCTSHSYPDGGSVCICTGPGFDTCDCPPVVA
jgi:hypothetical protein